MTNLLNNLGISGSAIIITVNSEEMVFRAGHNLPKIWTTPVNLLNANDLLSRQSVVITEDAVDKLDKLWAAPLSHRQRRLAQLDKSLMANGIPTNPTASSEALVEAPPEATIENAEAVTTPARPRRRRTAKPEADSGEREST
jgi:hypothetical protein